MLRATLRTIKAIASYGLVAGAIALMVLSVVLPRAIGGNALTVRTGSMTPTLPVGSLVVVRPVDPAQVEVGDVITFVRSANSNDVTTHRVVDVNRDAVDGLSFTTKGDANTAEDSSPVDPEAVRGRVWFHVPYVGILRSWLTSTIGLTSMAGAALLVFSADALGSQLHRLRRRTGRGRRADVPTADGSASKQGLLLFTVERLHPRRRDVDDLIALWGAEVIAADAVSLTARLVADHPALKSAEATLDDIGVTAIARADVEASPAAERFGSSEGQGLALIRVRAGRQDRSELLALVTLLSGRVIAVESGSLWLALAGPERELTHAVTFFNDYEVLDSRRSPTVSIPQVVRGTGSLITGTTAGDTLVDPVLRLATLATELRRVSGRNGADWCK